MSSYHGWTDNSDGQLMELVAEQVQWGEIARRMGISLNAAKARFQRLRKQMGAQAQ